MVIVRISKEISGRVDRREDPASQGRGEYEWCELIDGVDPPYESLLNGRIIIRLPDGKLVDTGCVFDFQGGKNRVRTVASGRELYPIWHAAAALMLPRPIRDENSWGGGLPILRSKQFGISHLFLRNVQVREGDRIEVEIDRIEVKNHYAANIIDFDSRYGNVNAIWNGKDRFDEEIRGNLHLHESLAIKGVDSFGLKGGQVVAVLQRQISSRGVDYSILPPAQNEDPLPALLEIL